MRTKIATGLLACSLLLLGSPGLYAEISPDSDAAPSQLFGVVEASRLNVRQGPGLDFNLVRVLQQGTQVVILERDPLTGWFSIAATTAPKEAVGWVSPDYVSVKAELQQENEAVDLEGATQKEVSEETGQPAPAVVPEPAAEATTVPTVSEPETVVQQQGDELPGEPMPSTEPQAETAEAEESEATAPALEQEAVTADSLQPADSATAPATEIAAVPTEEQEILTAETSDWQLDGRKVFLQLSPGFNRVIEDRGGQVEEDAFRITGVAGVEIVGGFFFEVIYSFTALRPSQSTHEVGGGWRYQRQLFWRWLPYLSADLFYSNVFDSDHVGIRGSAGLTFDFGGDYYKVLFGPFLDYNRVFLGDPADLESLVFGAALILMDSNI